MPWHIRLDLRCRTHIQLANRGEVVNIVLIVTVDRVQDHSWLPMHICKFSYLKGSIRVTLSGWQLERSAVFLHLPKVNEYLCACELETRVQVEKTAWKTHNSHKHTHTHTDQVVHKHWLQCLPLPLGFDFIQKQINCDWDYRLVKVALLWCMTECFLPLSLSPSLALFAGH